ncbi:MAG: zinc ribbon domain-containing protein [Nitrospinae bacterium]|nr:zinc ribbon domain-containing protein [Nitrospinota bacterium]
MPIYEFVCESCGHPFEAIVPNFSSTAPCPSCKGREVKKQLSVFAAHTNPGGEAPCQTPACGYKSGACGSGMCGVN